MAYLKEIDEQQLIDEFMEDAEDDEVGFFGSYINYISKVAIGGVLRGFFTGVGAFFGMLF